MFTYFSASIPTNSKDDTFSCQKSIEGMAAVALPSEAEQFIYYIVIKTKHRYTRHRRGENLYAKSQKITSAKNLTSIEKGPGFKGEDR